MRTRVLVFLMFFAATLVWAQAAGTFTTTGNMAVARSGHTATLLANGKVLIAGGEAAPDYNTTLATAELYDPLAGTFKPTGNMTTARSRHTATLLADGRVLIAGGVSVPPSCTSNCYNPWDSAEIYDPATGTFAATGNMLSGIAEHQANLLGDGRVLIVAGEGANFQIPNAEVYDPVAGTFAGVGAYASNTSNAQGGVSTILADGKVLIVWDSSEAEIFDPAAGSFTATANVVTRDIPLWAFGDGLPTATLLLSGKVLLTGGANDFGINASAELYDPTTGTFAAAGTMTTGRFLQTATLLPDGSVLMTGGGPWVASAESYNPAGDVFTSSGNMTTPRGGGCTATLLNDGRVLIAGGNPIDSPSSFAELYTPASLVAAPALFSLPGGGGAVWHSATGQIASSDNPAVPGEILSMYTNNLANSGVIPPQISVGGQLAGVLYFGPAPGYPGYFQVNFQVPPGVAAGSTVPVRLTYLGRSSNAVTIGVN
jgi:hypothetical protein